MRRGDFTLHNTYDDALHSRNKWSYCNYNDKGVGFPRECGPRGAVPGQWSSKAKGKEGQGQRNVKFYIESDQMDAGDEVRKKEEGEREREYYII